jgi:hypothetical protein
MNKRIKGIEDTLNTFIDTLNQKLVGPDPHGVPKKIEEPSSVPEELQVQDVVPLVEGKEYKFMSPHLSFKLMLGGGIRKPIDGYGNYELTPVVLADFSELTDGPMGFWKTDEHELVKEVRAYIKRQVRKEVVEVTDDPTYAHI